MEVETYVLFLDLVCLNEWMNENTNFIETETQRMNLMPKQIDWNHEFIVELKTKDLNRKKSLEWELF